MKVKQLLFGNNTGKMPDLAFKFMQLSFKIYYFIRSPGKYLEKFAIKPGYTVIDYGCGPGAFIRSASKMVGDKGLVYAVDVQELAILSVRKIIKKYKLNNVIPVLSNGMTSSIADDIADLIYAFDMFHMVIDTSGFLQELKRIAKKDAILIIEDGHQPRTLSKNKIINSGCWEIKQEQKRFITCKPK